MKQKLLLAALCTLLFGSVAALWPHADGGYAAPDAWGFFGHRKINRQAVFALPPEMMVFFKPNIDYLTDHSVDPDMRRYTSRYEAPRHFIDLDRYGKPPFADLPRNWTDALLCHSGFYFLRENGDTLPLFTQPLLPCFQNPDDSLHFHPNLAAGTLQALTYRQFRAFFAAQILPHYYDDPWGFSPDSLRNELGISTHSIPAIMVVDTFSQHGIVPYHLSSMMRQLSKAFQVGDPDRVLRLAADMGHYIADAHVPLHTTRNYNGQLTNQPGIHAFWESRLPELFADEQYDFWVGKAGYIEDKERTFWSVVLESHALVDSVLLIEKELSQAYPPDRQYCNELRGNALVRVICADYAAAYHQRLGGMVEQRMHQAIRTVSNAWYTAWVDAGRPDLSMMAALPAAALVPPTDTLPNLRKAIRAHE